MNSDFGFENRKAFIERGRDQSILNNQHQQELNNKKITRLQQIQKRERFDNTIKMNSMTKENFNRNFNKNI